MSNSYTILTDDRVIVLPQPQWGDTERGNHVAIFNRTMDGTCYSIIRTVTSRTYTWTFELPRLKAIEFLDFYEEKNASLWQIERPTDTLTGYVKLNPATLEMLRRGVSATSEEVVSLQMEFETI